MSIVVRPSHTLWDGDTVFTLATGEVEASQDVLERLSEQAVAESIRRGVMLAEGVPGAPAAGEGR